MVKFLIEFTFNTHLTINNFQENTFWQGNEESSQLNVGCPIDDSIVYRSEMLPVAYAFDDSKTIIIIIRQK